MIIIKLKQKLQQTQQNMVS